jgi:hypothetical protein
MNQAVNESTDGRTDGARTLGMYASMSKSMFWLASRVEAQRVLTHARRGNLQLDGYVESPVIWVIAKREYMQDMSCMEWFGVRNMGWPAKEGGWSCT